MEIILLKVIIYLIFLAFIIYFLSFSVAKSFILTCSAQVSYVKNKKHKKNTGMQKITVRFLCTIIYIYAELTVIKKQY